MILAADVQAFTDGLAEPRKWARDTLGRGDSAQPAERGLFVLGKGQGFKVRLGL